MHPVACAVRGQHPRILEILQTSINRGISRPAFLAPHQHRLAGDPAPQRGDLLARHVIGRPQADVVVEFPAVGAVLILVGAVLRQVARLLRRQVRVRLLHAGICVLQRRIAPRLLSRELPLLVDPPAHPFRHRHFVGLHVRAWARTKPLDRHQPADVLRIDPAIAQRNVAAERVGDDGNRRQFLLMDQLRQIIDVVRHGVAAGRRPGGITVAAQVRCDHVVVPPQIAGDPVPVAAMIASAMQQDQRRRIGVAPVDVVQTHSLRDEMPRGRTGFHQRHPMGGFLACQRVAFSYAEATRSTVASSK